jgi:hypothetical protein
MSIRKLAETIVKCPFCGKEMKIDVIQHKDHIDIMYSGTTKSILEEDVHLWVKAREKP